MRLWLFALLLLTFPAATIDCATPWVESYDLEPDVPVLVAWNFYAVAVWIVENTQPLVAEFEPANPNDPDGLSPIPVGGIVMGAGAEGPVLIYGVTLTADAPTKATVWAF